MQTAERKLGAKYRGAIFSNAGKAGIESDALHDIVLRLTGMTSITQLTEPQAIKVIEHLRALAGEEREPLGWLTKPQRNKIFALCRTLGWVTPEDEVDMARLEGFVKARIGVARINWLQRDKAGRLIEALKAMAEGGRGERKDGAR